MRGMVVDIETDDGVADAYLSRPDDDERRPGVLFVMDAYGLRPWIAEMTERIAAAGYVVLATAAGSRPTRRTARTVQPRRSGPRRTSGTQTRTPA